MIIEQLKFGGNLMKPRINNSKNIQFKQFEIPCLKIKENIKNIITREKSRRLELTQ